MCYCELALNDLTAVSTTQRVHSSLLKACIIFERTHLEDSKLTIGTIMFSA